MTLATLPVRILWILPFVAVAAYQPEQPREGDAGAIYGCYVAPGAPSFILGASGMRVEGSAAPIPFRYDFAKVGYGTPVPLNASLTNGHRSVARSAEDYFYRRSPFSDPPIIIVAFDRKETVVNYRRVENARCVI